MESLAQNLLPLLEQAVDADGEVDSRKARPLIDAEIVRSLDALRSTMEVMDRFDMIQRLAFREVAHDPETYVESEHNGHLSVLLLAMSVAAEFPQPSVLDPEVCDADRIESIHHHALKALHLATMRAAVDRKSAPGGEAAWLALAREVHWGPPAWPEDQRLLLDELFDGVADEILRETTGFGRHELLGVVDAVQTAAEYVSTATLVEKKPFRLQRSGIHALTELSAEAVDQVLAWFTTPLSQSPVTDPVESIRTMRLRPVLQHDDQICWATPDLISWALQLSFEEKLKGSPRFNRYQRHRAAVVEGRAVEVLAGVLNPQAIVRGGRYTGSLGEGEVDGLLLVDNVAVVVEAKGQMLTTRARQGDPTRLETNLNDILGTGSAQIGRLIRTLRSDGHLMFNDGTTVRSNDIGHVFGVVATLDELNALAVASTAVAALGVELDRDAAPAVFSVYGLTEACRVLDTPWMLLHYLHRRRETSRRVELFALEELDVVMFHLRQNLFFDDAPEGSPVWIGIETDALDAWDYYRRGSRMTPAPKPTQRAPLHLRRLLDGLSRRRPPGWVEIVFHLLDFDHIARDEVSRMVGDARRLMRQDRLSHDFTIVTERPEPHGISVAIGAPGATGLADRAHFLANLNGLRHSATRWLALAVEAHGDLLDPIETAVLTPPFDQVVPASKLRPSPAWRGGRRVVVKSRRRRDDVP